LRIGRHFRISENAKLVISRDESEYHLLQPYISGRYFFEIKNVIGGIAIGSGEFSEEDMELASRLLGRYSKANPDEEIQVHVILNEKTWDVNCTGLSATDPLISSMRI
jgi:ribosomal quality control pathway NFACT family protein